MDILDSIIKESKGGGILRSPLSKNSSRVHFEAPSNLKDILSKYSDREECLEEIQGLMTHAQNLQGAALITWIEELQESIPLLNKKLEGFVKALFKISWVTQEAPVADAFKVFLINLLSAHSFYITDIVQSLVSNFLIKNDQISHNTHKVLEVVLLTCPLDGKRVLLQSLSDTIPYIMTPASDIHTSYFDNLLKLLRYAKDIRLDILRLIIQRAVELDVRLPKISLEEENEKEEELNGETQFDFDDSVSTFMNQSASSSQVNPIIKARNNMEQLMTLLLNFVEEESKGTEAKQLYLDFLSLFDSHILSTWATEHVQFVLFYLVSKDPLYALNFLSWLWKKFQSPSTHSIERQSAIAYIVSLIARGKFIPLNTAKCYLEKIVSWIHLYIKNSEYANKDFMYADIKTHGPFYAAVQSALYMFAFRHEEFMDNKKNLEFLKSLNFNTIITCSLNPLRVCLPPVVKNFASISRNYQLAYCDTIIQRNNRINLPIVGSLSESSSSAKPLLLDSFFPFDPYSLKDSDSFISPLYREYSSGSNAESVSDSEEEEEEEGEGMEIGSLKEVTSFHYGTSPGFKMI